MMTEHLYCLFMLLGVAFCHTYIDCSVVSGEQACRFGAGVVVADNAC